MKFHIAPVHVLQDDLAYELVERKGLGHPDTIADGLAEAMSLAYANYTRDHFGAVLHHNLDKLGVRGGQWQMTFGQCSLHEPVIIAVGGRISCSFARKEIPSVEILENAGKDYIGKILPRYPVQDKLVFQHNTTSRSAFNPWFNPLSLDDVPDYLHPWANDTAAVVGYWPLSKVEQLCFQLERFFYRQLYESRFKDVGHDIKIMAARWERHINVTMCVPLLYSEISGLEAYYERIEELTHLLNRYALECVGEEFSACVQVNTQDSRVKRKNAYLCATGSCIDFGEEGFVGRGNSHNGLISSCRPASVEATYGKNPSYHFGKVGAYFAREIARALYQQFGLHNHVVLKANIGDDIRRPAEIVVGLLNGEGHAQKELEEFAASILSERNYLKDILRGYFLPSLGPEVKIPELTRLKGL